jgi:hypothetical protein
VQEPPVEGQDVAADVSAARVSGTSIAVAIELDEDGDPISHEVVDFLRMLGFVLSSPCGEKAERSGSLGCRSSRRRCAAQGWAYLRIRRSTKERPSTKQFCRPAGFSPVNGFASRQLFRRPASFIVFPVGSFFAGQRVFRRSAVLPVGIFSPAGEFFADRRVLPVGSFFAGRRVFRRPASVAGRQLFRRPASFSPVNSFASRQLFRRSTVLPVGSSFASRRVFAGWQLFASQLFRRPAAFCRPASKSGFNIIGIGKSQDSAEDGKSKGKQRDREEQNSGNGGYGGTNYGGKTLLHIAA